jgi:hypothetical protein
MLCTKKIKLVGKILYITIRPKQFNLSVKLILCFRFIDFKVIKSSSLVLEDIHNNMEISNGVIN